MTQLPSRPKIVNLVHNTEQGRLFLDRMHEGLRHSDPIPPLVRGAGTQSAQAQINALREKIRACPSFDAAASAVLSSPYFKPHTDGHTIIVAQIRNELPSDSTVVYHHEQGKFQLSSMYSVAHVDPIGPLLAKPWVLPPTQLRGERDLQRCVFGLHEFSTPEALLESYTYRAIYDDLRVSWHAVVLERTREFTWVMYVWFHADRYANISETVRLVRAGLNRVALPLAETFQASLTADRGEVFTYPDSVHTGLLALSKRDNTLRRQNFAAEVIFQGLSDPYERISVERKSIHARIRLEYERRVAAGEPLSWVTDPYLHPIVFHPSQLGTPATVRVRVAQTGYQDELLFRLEELRLPHLPAQKWWCLPQHKATGVATSLRKLGEFQRGEPGARLPPGMSAPTAAGYFIKGIMCVARPVWDIDVMADRIYRYHRVEATKLGRNEPQGIDFAKHPTCALLFRNDIMGVLQAI